MNTLTTISADESSVDRLLLQRQKLPYQ